MKIEQKEWTEKSKWIDISNNDLSKTAQLVLAFGCKEALEKTERYQEIEKFYPNAHVVICSTAGEILDNKISDDSINTTAVKFDSTKIEVEMIKVSDPEKSFETGIQLIESLKKEDLVYTLVISDGQIVNGTELTRGLGENFHAEIAVTGGLAGDGPNFQTTLVGLNEPPGSGNVVGIGFYGKNLKVGHAAKGGWDPFGPERVVTKSKNNILFELDDQSALDIYKNYLGDLADDLPGSALLFPLGLKLDSTSVPLVRTVIGVNEEDGSMIFVGDLPEGSIARMMRSNFDRLIDGASKAAESCMADFGSFDPDLAIIISCAGRKFVLRDRVEEEVDKVRDVLGNHTVISGFYSYGEISPIVKSTKCELHNQTMTITTLKEVV